MKGLIKNNYYKLASSLKVFSLFLFLLGIATVVFDNRNTSLLIGFSYLSIVLFPISSLIGLGKNNTGKWKQYTLSLPVRRGDIVKSTFLSQLFVILIGLALTGLVFSISFLIHGFPFYRHIDVLLQLSFSMGVSLLMSAIFSPISHIDTKDRPEVISIISLIVSTGILMSLITVVNIFFKKPNDIQLILFSIGLLSFSSLCYFVSWEITRYLYSKKDF